MADSIQYFRPHKKRAGNWELESVKFPLTHQQCIMGVVFNLKCA